LDKIAIHKFKKGKFHPKFGGEAMNYWVVSGPNPFGPRGGACGNVVDGVVRGKYRSCPEVSSEQAYEKAVNQAIKLAIDEGLFFVTEDNPGECGFSGGDVFNKPVADLSGAIEDTRIRKATSVVVRSGQMEFRRELLKAYNGACCISGCAVPQVLHGAHIRPYLGVATNHVTNGLLLRADLHLLFDANLIAVSDDYILLFSDVVDDTDYVKYRGVKINLPLSQDKMPSICALRWHASQLKL
jgi:hypothetical protein